MLEEKLDASSKRVERVIELENDLIKYKEKIDMICKVRNKKIKNLLPTCSIRENWADSIYCS